MPFEAPTPVKDNELKITLDESDAINIPEALQTRDDSSVTNVQKESQISEGKKIDKIDTPSVEKLDSGSYNFKIDKRKAKIGAAITFAAFMLAGIGFAANHNNKPQQVPVTTTEETEDPTGSTSLESSGISTSEATEALTSETSQVAPETSNSSIVEGDKAGDMVKNIAEGYGFVNLSPEQQETIKKYDMMDYEDFRALPIEEQQAFDLYIFNNYKPTFDLILKVNLTDEESKNIYYTENPTTPEQIVANYAYLMTMACNLFEYNEDGNGLHKDIDTGKKLVSIITTMTDEHIKSSDYIIDGANITDIVTINISGISGESQINSDGSVVVNTKWESTKYVTIAPGAEFSQKTFIKQSPGDNGIDGKQQVIYLRSLAVNSSDESYIDLG